MGLFNLGCARGDANMLLTVPEFSETDLFTVLHNARFAASNTPNGLLSNVPNVVLPLGTLAQTKLPVTTSHYMSGRLATVELPEDSLLACLEGLPVGSLIYFPYYTKEGGKLAAVLDYANPDSLAWSYDIIVTKINDDLYSATRST